MNNSEHASRLKKLSDDLAEVHRALDRLGSRFYADALDECVQALRKTDANLIEIRGNLRAMATEIEMFQGDCRGVQILRRVAANLTDLLER